MMEPLTHSPCKHTRQEEKESGMRYLWIVKTLNIEKKVGDDDTSKRRKEGREEGSGVYCIALRCICGMVSFAIYS